MVKRLKRQREPRLQADQTVLKLETELREKSSGCMNVTQGAAHKNPNNLEFSNRKFREHANSKK